MPAQNRRFRVNLGLYTLTAEVTGSSQGDLWYNSNEGRAKLQVGSNIGVAGPHGSHPMIYGISNGWYPLQPGGGAHTAVAVTNNRAYAYPLYPGRKCTLAGFTTRITAAGAVGNLRMMLYAGGVDSLPGALIADYSTQSAAVGGATTISGWTVSTALEPTLYWVVLASQTSTAPSMSRYTTFNPMVPWPVTTPSMGTADQYNCLYTDTGFSGSPPTTFGAPAGVDYGPMILCKLTQ